MNPEIIVRAVKAFVTCAAMSWILAQPSTAAPPAVEWEAPVRVASGQAYQGPWRMNESRFLYVDDPAVAAGIDGIVAVAWADNERQDIFLQLFDRSGNPRLDEPVNVSRSPGVFSWLPRLAMAGEEIHVLWQEILFTGGSHGGEILYARSSDGGRTFSEPMNLSNSPAGAGKGRLSRRIWHNGSLDLTRAPDGTLYAAWTEYEGALRLSRSDDGGKTFSRPLRIAGSARRPARGPSLAAAAEGRVYLAWSVGEDTAADIHVAVSTDRGETFSEPQPVHPGDGRADAPKLAIDRRGIVHLAYAEGPGGPLEAYRIIYTRAEEESLDFDAPRDVSGAHASRFAAVGFPHLAVDGAGRVYLAWELFPRFVREPHGMGFALSADGGDSFDNPEVVPGSDDRDHGSGGGRQGLLMRKLAVDESGRIAIVHSTYQTGAASRIWLHGGRRAQD